MIIGIIGAGYIGATLARHFVELGHEVYVSNSRGPETLADVEAATGARAVTVEQAAARGEIVVEAIPFGRYRSLPASELAGKLVISAANYYPGRDGEIDLQGKTQSELVAGHLAGSRLVKAFNTIYWEHLRDQRKPDAPVSERRVIPLAGDDETARQDVARLIEAIGFGPLDLGSLAVGGARMEPGCPIYNKDVTVAEARALLGM